MKKLILSIFTFLLTACSHHFNVSNYYPTDNDNPRLGGILAIGNFSYQPASLGLVQANQLEKSGGKIKEFSGEHIHSPHFILNFKYLINYKITDRKNNAVLLERDYFVLYHTDFNNYLNNPALYLSKIIYAGYEKFAKDNDVIQILKDK